MRPIKFLRKQLSDLMVYVILPGLSVVLPSAWSRSIVARISKRKGLLQDHAEIAWRSAIRYLDIGDEVAWKTRWKQVEIMDARDLYMMMSGRTVAVLAEIDLLGEIESVKNSVMVGMHWGPSISVLKLAASQNLLPAFPYRPPEKQLFHKRPFYYLYLRLATRYLTTTLAQRAVTIGGAGRAVLAMLNEPGSIFVLMDAPPMADRPVITSQVLNKDVSFNAGLPGILAENHKQYMFYTMSLHPDGSLRKQLELKGPYHTENAVHFIRCFSEFMHQHLTNDAAQWRLWQAAGQLWRQT